MLKLMKYEFRKTWITKLILLGVTAVAEIAFLIGLYVERETTLGLSVMLLVFLALGGIAMIGLYSVMTLHRDMNTKQSYMLFMTPNSSYSILGAKVLECGLSILIGGAFYFALGTLDITLLFAKSGELNRLWSAIQDFLSHLTFANHQLLIDMKGMAAFVFCLLAGWIVTVITAYFAVVISAALLNGKRFNGLLSFVVFLTLSWFIGWVAQTATASIPSINVLLLVDGAISLAFTAVMYVITAIIMERKLSV
ncbi:MAG: hypothetical protein IJ664_06375 [Clostridia bacterium]|nr:hypothetical protein [Clostridia bacterium]